MGTTTVVTGAAAAGAIIGGVIGAAVGAPLAGAVLGAVVGGIVGDLANSIFGDLFGGGSPPIPRQLLHRRHPLYPAILRVPVGLIPDEMSAGAPQFVGDPDPKPNARPLQKETPPQKKRQQARVELEQCFAVFEAAPDIPESIALYVCEVDPEEVGRVAACAGAVAMEIPKKIGEGKCLYDYYQACK